MYVLTYSRRYCTYLVSGDDEWLRKYLSYGWMDGLCVCVYETAKREGETARERETELERKRVFFFLSFIVTNYHYNYL